MNYKDFDTVFLKSCFTNSDDKKHLICNIDSGICEKKLKFQKFTRVMLLSIS